MSVRRKIAAATSLAVGLGVVAVLGLGTIPANAAAAGGSQLSASQQSADEATVASFAAEHPAPVLAKTHTDAQYLA